MVVRGWIVLIAILAVSTGGNFNCPNGIVVAVLLSARNYVCATQTLRANSALAASAEPLAARWHNYVKLPPPKRAHTHTHMRPPDEIHTILNIQERLATLEILCEIRAVFALLCVVVVVVCVSVCAAP